MKALHWTALAVILGASPAYAALYLTAEQAQQLMFPDARAVKDATLQLSPAQMREIEALSGLPARSAHLRVVSAWQGSRLLGHMVMDDVIGKVELTS